MNKRPQRKRQDGLSPMIRFLFWQKWLVLVALYLSVFGFVLAVFPHSSLMNNIFNEHINPVFWIDSNLPKNAEHFQAWIYGVLGATVCGWGVLMTFILLYPFRARETWAWNGMAAAFCIWFLVDTLISAFRGVWFNVFFNAILFLMTTIPLIMTKKYFTKNGSDLNFT